MYDHADQERDSRGTDFATEHYEWLFPKTGDRLSVVQVKRDIAQVELLSGEYKARRLWIRTDCRRIDLRMEAGVPQSRASVLAR